MNPGEIIFLDNGIETLKQLNGKRKTCAFEWGYWARIDSIIEDISVKGMRERCGIILAKDDKKRGFEPEMIMPIRDSGVGYAIGYHHGSEVPYDEGLFKNLYLARSYIQPTQLARTEVAERKQSIIRGAIDGKIIVVVDDSIRRGTTIKELIHSLKNAGAKEVHLRIGSPENKYPCKYSVFPKKKGELLAERSKEEQRKFIGADSLEYISLDDYVRAIGIPEEQLCLECWEQNC